MTAPILLSSRANPRYKSLIARLAPGGAKRGCTLLLGAKLIEAWAGERGSAAASRLRPALWLRLEGARPHALERELEREGLDTWTLGESLMRDLADAGSPPEHALLAELGPEPQGPLPERVIVPWGIQDPGNLGAILRSAAAFGFQEVLLGPGCADPFSPKALRGSMGAAFLLPLRRALTGCPGSPREPRGGARGGTQSEHGERAVPPRSGQILEPDGGHWYALDGGPRSIPLPEADLSAPLRLLVGNEGHGWRDAQLPPQVRFLAIPMGGVESLNAAVAAGIACYEVRRRERA